MSAVGSLASALFTGWRTEPALFLYMFGSFLKMPVFQNLLFEKSCWLLYELKDCSVVDSNRIRVSLLIPYVALAISTLVYIIASIFEHSSPYFLLISDVIFGLFGGYTSIIGVSAAFAVRGSTGSLRSTRVARLEGSIGLGSVIGNLLSGTIRKAVGYTAFFSIILGLQLLAVLYILVFVKNDEYEDIPDYESQESGNSFLWRIFVEPVIVLTRPRPFHAILIMLVIAFGLELFAFSGQSDILYSFMRYRLAWDDVAYGQFSSLTSLCGTIGVLLIYPFLRLIFSDVLLGCLGLLFKVIFLTVLSATHSAVVVYCLAGLYLGSRFVSTAFRTQVANLVNDDEQGKMSSLVSILEGVCGLLATAILNNLYPMTLSFWSGLCPLLIGLLLAVSFVLLLISHVVLRKGATSMNEAEAAADETHSETLQAL